MPCTYKIDGVLHQPNNRMLFTAEEGPGVGNVEGTAPSEVGPSFPEKSIVQIE